MMPLKERPYWGYLILQSHVQDDHYYTYYAIEPMLEVLWTEETTHEDTRYKVLFPITTPLLSRPPQVIDSESLFLHSVIYFFLNDYCQLPPFLFILPHRHGSRGEDVQSAAWACRLRCGTDEHCLPLGGFVRGGLQCQRL